MTRVASPPLAAPAAHDLPGRLQVLDGLRGAAMLLVVWHHVIEFQLPVSKETWLGWLRTAGNLSWSGSDLFFVLSGFFAGRALFRPAADARGAGAFLMRRTLRIVPLYLLVLTILYVGGTALSPAVHIKQSFWSYATLLANFSLAFANTWDWIALSIYWFIAVEFQFCLAASLLVLVRPVAVAPLLIAAIVAAQLLRWGVHAAAPDATVAQYTLPFLRMDTFAWGLLLARLALESPEGRTMRALRRHAPLLLGATIALLAVLTLLRPRQGDATLVHGGYAAIALGYAVIVGITLARPPALLQRVLTLRPAVWIGRRTYGIYLWHAGVSWAVFHIAAGPSFVLDSWRSATWMIVALGLTGGFAALGWRWIEQPLLDRARKISPATA